MIYKEETFRIKVHLPLSFSYTGSQTFFFIYLFFVDIVTLFLSSQLRLQFLSFFFLSSFHYLCPFPSSLFTSLYYFSLLFAFFVSSFIYFFFFIFPCLFLFFPFLPSLLLISYFHILLFYFNYVIFFSLSHSFHYLSVLSVHTGLSADRLVQYNNFTLSIVEGKDR